MILSEDALRGAITVVKGEVSAELPSAYSIVRDEIYLLPAFFDHYRKLGIRQFLILDDGSTDGTREFLSHQSDCVLLSAPVKFGQKVTLIERKGKTDRARADIFLKRIIPQTFLSGRYSVGVDADEFLVLPPEVVTIPELFAVLALNKIPCVAASLVDFYPADKSGLSSHSPVESFEELVSRYPYFDSVSFVSFRSDGYLEPRGESFHSRIFRSYGIRHIPASDIQIPTWIGKLLPLPVPRGPYRKTPVVCCNEQVWLKSSHKTNIPPTKDLLLCLAHFKFTSALKSNITTAIATGCHARKSRKYRHYRQLLKAMPQHGPGFLGPQSKRFTGAEDLIDAGLLKWGIVSPSVPD